MNVEMVDVRNETNSVFFFFFLDDIGNLPRGRVWQKELQIGWEANLGRGNLFKMG